MNDNTLSYRVWSMAPIYMEEPQQTRVVAAFQYMQEARDYVDYLIRGKVRCILTGPYKFVSVYEVAT